MKKRSRTARQGRAGVIAVDDACNRLDLIWRNILEEDVGVDGTIEIALGEFPTGKIVGAQIKSGASYIRAETETGFSFYPDKDDMEYWRALSIPLFLLIHHPTDDCVYWVDVTRLIETRSADPDAPTAIAFAKAQKLDRGFESYLHSRFDLVVHSDDQYADLRGALEALVHEDGSGEGAIRITGLDLFIEGLWGLCSKLQFHSSLLADLIRKSVRDREGPVPVTYTFSRAALYPFFIRYFSLLSDHSIASLDTADINASLYQKLEFPTFIAPLTTNGRGFVRYLRARGLDGVHDNQFMSLSVRPHVQIEVYQDFSLVDGRAAFGPYTDVLAIGFNAYLDYYHLSHWHRGAPDEAPIEIATQTISYHALRDYIAFRFAETSRDNLVFRYLDVPLTPLICWLEQWNPQADGMPTSALQGRSANAHGGFFDEMTAIMAPSGIMTIQEPPVEAFPIQDLASGERLHVASSSDSRP